MEYNSEQIWVQVPVYKCSRCSVEELPKPEDITEVVDHSNRFPGYRPSGLVAVSFTPPLHWTRTIGNLTLCPVCMVFVTNAIDAALASHPNYTPAKGEAFDGVKNSD